jgi:hypothetical protein
MSLPGVFGTTVETIPAPSPYLFADAAMVEQHRAELARFPGFKIGVAWQGSPKHRRDHERSFPLALLEPLAHRPGVQLFSLQRGYGSEQLSRLDGRFPIIDLGRPMEEQGGDFLDTAAVVKSLDLVVAADTAVAHLAGGLGVPVWMATPFAPDWRWLSGRDDSPWYPTMRLFRQKQPGDWQEVFQRMAAEL